MNKENIHQTIQQFIATGKTKAVFPFLKKQDLSTEQSAAVAVIETAFNKLQKDSLKGTLSYKDERLQRNKINDQLLSIFHVEGVTSYSSKKTSNLSKLGVGLLLLAIAGIFIWGFESIQHTCPSFPKEKRHKIIIMPFENVAGGEAKSQTRLRDKMNQLASENKLSTHVGLGTSLDVNTNNATLIAQNCKANVIIWGTYSSDVDSLQMTLHYKFAKMPEERKLGDIIATKEVLDVLLEGTMLKTQEDALLALCGVIALREGHKAQAEKWFSQVNQKEQMDTQLLEALR